MVVLGIVTVAGAVVWGIIVAVRRAAAELTEVTAAQARAAEQARGAAPPTPGGDAAPQARAETDLGSRIPRPRGRSDGARRRRTSRLSTGR